jgi:hypothetical protein
MMGEKNASKYGISFTHRHLLPAVANPNDVAAENAR